MPVLILNGDVFCCGARTLAHGVNCRGKMRAGIATEFARRFPEMYREYQLRCKRGELRPGGTFLWKERTPWVLNLATQDRSEGAELQFVCDALDCLAKEHVTSGITSLAMPRIAAGLGGLSWPAVRNEILCRLDPLRIPVFVYEQFVPGISGNAIGHDDKGEAEPVLFGRGRGPEWSSFSNFVESPLILGGREYPTVEHYFQASKAATSWEHELVRTASTPSEAKKLGRSVVLRPDWDDVKIDVMLHGLLAKFRQHPSLREVLMRSGNRSIHEASPHDAEWGWMNGAGQDLLGKQLMRAREIIRSELSIAAGCRSSGEFP